MAFPILGILPFAEKLVERIFPDPAVATEAKIKLAELQQSGALAQLAAETDLSKGQMEINKIDAASTDKFASRWRPFIGWTCGFAFAYNLVVQPFLQFCLIAFGSAIKPTDLPIIDGELLMMALGGILGLGTMRSFERVKGIIK